MTKPGQSRAGSFAEALANVLTGYALALVIQRVAYPLFGIATTLATDSVIAALFTAASLVRSYLIRRLFEALTYHGCFGKTHART